MSNNKKENPWPKLVEITALVRYSVVIHADSKEQALKSVESWEHAWDSNADLVGVSDVEVLDIRDGEKRTLIFNIERYRLMNKTVKQKAAVLALMQERKGVFMPPSYVAVFALNGKPHITSAASYYMRALERDGLVKINEYGWGKAI